MKKGNAERLKYLTPCNRRHQQHNQWDLIMLQANNTLSGAMRLCDLMYQPADQVIEYLKDQHEAIGEAVAKMCYQELSRRGSEA